MKQAALFVGIALVVGVCGMVRFGPPPVQARAPDDKLSARVKVILEKNCRKCHAETKASGVLDVRDWKTVTTVHKSKSGKIKTYVVARDLKKSLLWRKIEDGEMPPEAGELSTADKDAVKQWIEAGAPNYNTEDVAGPRPYMSQRAMLEAIRDHLRSADEEDRPYLRYFTLAHLHNNNTGINEVTLGRYRAALAKALNSMHWRKPIVRLVPLERSQGTVFPIDLRDLDWDQKAGEKIDRWDAMLAGYPYALRQDETDDEGLNAAAKDLKDYEHTRTIHIRGDWFVAMATRPPLYETVLRLPKTAGELEKRLGVDAVANFKRNRLARAGFKKSGVSEQNRLVERHDSLYGAYWKSYDFKPEAEKSDLLQYPLGPARGWAYPGGKYPFARRAFKQAGGEMIFNLPNGLQGYFLVDAKDEYIKKGPTDVVRDLARTSGNVEIVNGLSCMACHASGTIDTVLDEVRDGTGLVGLDRRKVRLLYPPRQTMLAWVEEDSKLFLTALQKAIGPHLAGADRDREIGEVAEPIGALVRGYYNQDLTLETAAYELGYEKPEKLEAAIEGSNELRKLGLRALLGNKKEGRKGGTLKRAEWEQKAAGGSKFQKVMNALNRGDPRNF